MSFRRPKQTNVGSSHWRLEHRAKLMLASRPSRGIDRHLLYVLLHGEDHADTGWTPAWLAPKTRPRFCDSSKRKSPSSRFRILDELRRLLAHR